MPHACPSLPTSASRLSKPVVWILATGGTIVSSGESPTQMTGYSIKDFRVEDLIDALPALAEVADVHAEQIANIDSSSMTSAIWLKLARRIEALLADPEVDGIVVTHGTDTLEETAYFLNLTVHSDKPVVLTGAMRPASALSADGPLNLLNAVRVAADAQSKGRGVLIALNDVIGSARDTTKTHPTNVATFASRDFGALGLIAGDDLTFFSATTKRHTLHSDFSLEGIETLPRVDIVYSHTDDDETFVRAAVAAGARGIIHAGTGNGSIHAATEPALKAAAKAGVVVVRASRVGGGATVNALAAWQQAGFIPAGTLLPQKARILLQLALTKSADPKDIARIFCEY